MNSIKLLLADQKTMRRLGRIVIKLKAFSRALRNDEYFILYYH